MCDDDDDVPLFAFRRFKVNLAATATVKAATGMSDDDDDVPCFDEKALAKHAARLHAEGIHWPFYTGHLLAGRYDLLNNKSR